MAPFVERRLQLLSVLGIFLGLLWATTTAASCSLFDPYLDPLRQGDAGGQRGCDEHRWAKGGCNPQRCGNGSKGLEPSSQGASSWQARCHRACYGAHQVGKVPAGSQACISGAAVQIPPGRRQAGERSNGGQGCRSAQDKVREAVLQDRAQHPGGTKVKEEIADDGAWENLTASPMQVDDENNGPPDAELLAFLQRTMPPTSMKPTPTSLVSASDREELLRCRVRGLKHQLASQAAASTAPMRTPSTMTEKNAELLATPPTIRGPPGRQIMVVDVGMP